jgi:hypothetical protein
MPTPLSNIGSGAEGPAATADAPDAQKEAAKCIKEAKADYLLAIKANAGEIFGDIAVFFDMGAAIEIGAGRVEVLTKAYGASDGFQKGAPTSKSGTTSWRNARSAYSTPPAGRG